MNISNLSQETLAQLVELAIAASPTKASHILLNNVMVVNATPMAATPTTIRTVELSWYEQHRRNKILDSLDKIMQFAIRGDKINAIKELRNIGGMGLKESKDTIEHCFGMVGPFRHDDYEVTIHTHWANLLSHFIKTGEYLSE